MTIEVPDDTVVPSQSNFAQEFYERALVQDQDIYTEILDGELKGPDSTLRVKLQATYNKLTGVLSVVQL